MTLSRASRRHTTAGSLSPAVGAPVRSEALFGRQAKYRNKPTVIDGIRFASQKEARRYGELRLLERAGEITDLVLQPRYSLSVNGAKITTYIADFGYFRQNKPVTEDVKGVKTPVFIIKAKLFRAIYSRDIELI